MTPFWWGYSVTPKQANYNGDYMYTAYVGATGDDGLGGTTEGYGAVHMIDMRTQRQIGKIGKGYGIDVPELGKFDRFGYAIAVDRGRLVVGAPQSDTQEPRAGRVYLFPIPERGRP